jgi:hypothetical protein
MGLMPASYKVTARSVSRVLGDGRRQSDRSLKGHEAGVRKGQPWAVNHHQESSQCTNWVAAHWAGHHPERVQLIPHSVDKGLAAGIEAAKNRPSPEQRLQASPDG